MKKLETVLAGKGFAEVEPGHWQKETAHAYLTRQQSERFDKTFIFTTLAKEGFFRIVFGERPKVLAGALNKMERWHLNPSSLTWYDINKR